MCDPRGLDIETEKNEAILGVFHEYYVIMECINCVNVSGNVPISGQNIHIYNSSDNKENHGYSSVPLSAMFASSH